MPSVLERRRRALEALREVRQPNSTAVYSRLCSRDPRSLSLGDAPFLHRSPEETYVCQRVCKAAKLCLSDARNPVWRTSDYDAAIWPHFVAWFARDLRRLSREKNDHLPRITALDSDSPRYFSRSPRATTSGVCRVRWEKAFPDPELHTRGRHFTTIDCRKQWKLLSERAWHAWQTHTHYALTARSTLHQPSRAKRNYH